MKAGRARCSQQACLPLTDLDGPLVPRALGETWWGRKGWREAWASDREARVRLEDRGVT